MAGYHKHYDLIQISCGCSCSLKDDFFYSLTSGPNINVARTRYFIFCQASMKYIKHIHATEEKVGEILCLVLNF